MNNLVIRAISGLVLVLVLVGGIVYSDISRIIVLAIVAIFSLWEMLQLLSKASISVLAKGIYTISSVAILFASIRFGCDIFTVIAILSTLLVVRFIIELYRKKERPLDAISYEIFAVFYTVLPIYLLMNIADYRVILTILILVWTNDVGAYIVGVTIGKHRLFERISPKKSWEGFWGGLVLVVIVSVLINKYWLMADTNYLVWIILGITTSVAAVFGDLFESMFKRSINVKDSGNTIPGHGGFLDRFDALFFAAPVYIAVNHFLSLIF